MRLGKAESRPQSSSLPHTTCKSDPEPPAGAGLVFRDQIRLFVKRLLYVPNSTRGAHCDPVPGPAHHREAHPGHAAEAPNVRKWRPILATGKRQVTQ